MFTRTMLATLLTVAALSGCDDSLVDRADRQELYLAESGDPAMEEAFRKARETLDDFLALARDPAPNQSRFAVKVGISEGDFTEYFWIALLGEADGGFRGIVNNEPDTVTTVEFGQEITFSRDEIVDWVYDEDERMVGNFTACAMLKGESEQDRKDFEARFGLRCEY